MASGEVTLVVNPHLIVGDRFTTYVEAAPHSLEIRATYPYGGAGGRYSLMIPKMESFFFQASAHAITNPSSSFPIATNVDNVLKKKKQEFKG